MTAVQSEKFQKHIHSTKIGKLPVLLVLALLFIAVVFVYLFVGRYWISPDVVFNILASKLVPIQPTWTPAMDAVVWLVRFPRALAVVLAGAGLAVSGAVFQGTFRNPLVSESILGVSSGAGFGAALGIMLGQTSYAIQLFAFVSALAAVGITYLIGRVHRSSPVLLLVLGGIIVGSLFSAFTSLIKYVADPLDKLPSIVFWLLGSFASITIDDIYLVAPGIVVCTIILLLLRWRLNVLSMGDEEAKALGVDAKKLRAVVIVCATIITAGVVCISGLIGWVGLIIPQMCRLIVGPNHKYLVPASILVGAQFLLFVDLICRTITPGEIPISIVTSIVGAPIFLYLLSKVKRGWV